MAQAQGMNIYEDPKKVRAQIKQERKKLKAQEKQHYKEMRERGRELEEREAELDQSAGGITSFFLTVAIIVMWLLIMTLLIRLDVGGFGSTVMAPIIKDVPYLNRILPEYARGNTDIAQPSVITGTEEPAVTSEYTRQLEADLAEARSRLASDSQTIDQLQAEIERLRAFESQQAAFEQQRTQFYNDIIYNDNAPDPTAYAEYFEMIDPERAAELYQQVVQSEAAEQEIQTYANAYAAMKPKEAAAIFDEMVANGSEHEVQLAARILLVMGSDDRGRILGKMGTDNAARLTDIMEPAGLPYP
ncbi:MAG: hypothetical protein IJQ21_03940 [Lachnospiraceae bacterium]|nr:hypothetical protein [Lachnospiraceae bacterium]